MRQGIRREIARDDSCGLRSSFDLGHEFNRYLAGMGGIATGLELRRRIFFMIKSLFLLILFPESKSGCLLFPGILL